jgi:hypothetical protein
VTSPKGSASSRPAASPYRAGREIERSKIEDKEDDEQD